MLFPWRDFGIRDTHAHRHLSTKVAHTQTQKSIVVGVSFFFLSFILKEFLSISWSDSFFLFSFDSALEKTEEIGAHRRRNWSVGQLIRNANGAVGTAAAAELPRNSTEEEDGKKKKKGGKKKLEIMCVCVCGGVNSLLWRKFYFGSREEKR